MADDFDGVMDILKRTNDLSGASDLDIQRLKRRSECVRYWLNGFAPEMVKFSVCKSMPDVQLSDDERKYLADLAGKLKAADWKAAAINETISESAKASPLGSKKGFQALYKILINRTAGPRLGAFLESMDKDFVIGRLTEASS